MRTTGCALAVGLLLLSATAGPLAVIRLFNEIEERLERGEQSLLFLNRRGYAPCTRFLAVASQHQGDLPFVGVREPFGGGLSGAVVHPHVQLTIVTKAEASRRIVELRRGYAEIEQDPVNAAGNAGLTHETRNIAKGPIEHLEAGISILQLPGHRDRFRIAVHRIQPPGRPEPAQNFAGMSATTERGVEINALLPNRQGVQHLGGKYRQMSAQFLASSQGQRVQFCGQIDLIGLLCSQPLIALLIPAQIVPELEFVALTNQDRLFFKVENDRRITRLGSLLRKTRLD